MVAASCAAVAVASLAIGNVTWARTSARAMRRLEDEGAPAAPGAPVCVSAEELAALPPPVARYFRFALSPEQRIVEHARFLQTGTMRAGAADPWKPFTAVEVFSTRPVGFVWDASATMMPLVALRIRDGYVAGTAMSEAKFAATIPAGKLPNTPEVRSASLVRYLAEAPWLPTALLPNSGVSWMQLDDDSARATLTDHDRTVSLDVEFAKSGEIVRSSAMRFRNVGAGEPVLTRWTGRYTRYERFEGMMIPMEADVGWNPPEGEFSVWRGRITSARYRFAAATS
ncbi:MAG: hypothetical protein JWM87_3148 [Candidatus Eremiobacteraeota bacterium]|nr:hypothetical protein [Candidatus Eremiobacteraeota bacterium]